VLLDGHLKMDNTLTTCDLYKSSIDLSDLIQSDHLGDQSVI
jgi:hypothetical protein